MGIINNIMHKKKQEEERIARERYLASKQAQEANRERQGIERTVVPAAIEREHPWQPEQIFSRETFPNQDPSAQSNSRQSPWLQEEEDLWQQIFGNYMPVKSQPIDLSSQSQKKAKYKIKKSPERNQVSSLKTEVTVIKTSCTPKPQATLLSHMLQKENIVNGIVLAEILGPPKSRRLIRK
ncbi:MAG: hypothetical protein ACOX7H_02460 [Bacillota bacterium]